MPLYGERHTRLLARRSSVLLDVERLDLWDLLVVDCTCLPVSGNRHAAAGLAGVAGEANETILRLGKGFLGLVRKEFHLHEIGHRRASCRSSWRCSHRRRQPMVA